MKDAEAVKSQAWQAETSWKQRSGSWGRNEAWGEATWDKKPTSSEEGADEDEAQMQKAMKESRKTYVEADNDGHRHPYASASSAAGAPSEVRRAEPKRGTSKAKDHGYAKDTKSVKKARLAIPIASKGSSVLGQN